MTQPTLQPSGLPAHLTCWLPHGVSQDSVPLGSLPSSPSLLTPHASGPEQLVLMSVLGLIMQYFHCHSYWSLSLIRLYICDDRSPLFWQRLKCLGCSRCSLNMGEFELSCHTTHSVSCLTEPSLHPPRLRWCFCLDSKLVTVSGLILDGGVQAIPLCIYSQFPFSLSREADFSFKRSQEWEKS